MFQCSGSHFYNNMATVRTFEAMFTKSPLSGLVQQTVTSCSLVFVRLLFPAAYWVELSNDSAPNNNARAHSSLEVINTLRTEVVLRNGLLPREVPGPDENTAETLHWLRFEQTTSRMQVLCVTSEIKCSVK